VFAPDELAMPAQECGWREHQLAALEVAAEGGQHQPIGWEEIRPFDLAAQNGDFVPKRQNLKLQFFGRAAVEFDGANDQPNHRIDGCEEHERGPYLSAKLVVVAKQPGCLRLRRKWNRNGFCVHHTRVQIPGPRPDFELRPDNACAVDRLQILNRRHLERVLTVWFEHYNEARPHRGLELRTPIARSDPVGTSGPVICVERLGGLPGEYSRAPMPAAA
jgi:integrase-like protein